MSHPKHKKQAEKSDRSEFFAARASTPKATGLLDQAQDGDGGNDTLPLRTPTGSHNLPVTQDFLQTCLEDMSSKILASIQSTLRELSKDVQELGDRTARVEQRVEEQTSVHNELADQVHNLQQLLNQSQRKIMDLEDRSRRQNLRIRGIPEEVSQQDLHPFLIEGKGCRSAQTVSGVEEGQKMIPQRDSKQEMGLNRDSRGSSRTMGRKYTRHT
ncbi:Hypothetical predicted protein [Pelobates cultripes]|uniref:Uncharacterized protein n=1 Tax=Pelobates cultripes TaxID=61616 RepID=A0AAD1VS48_PELCU|nr:Hypothetical predicted protein [Pelobates cultripes]